MVAVLDPWKIPCDGCGEYRHYQEDFAYEGGKRSSWCNVCTGKKVEASAPKKSRSPKPKPKPKRNTKGSRRRFSGVQWMKGNDVIIAALEAILDGDDEMVRGMSSPIDYYGAKNSLITWLSPLLDWRHNPNHIFVDAFCGSGAVIFSQPPAAAEIINDRDSLMVNFMRVLRDFPDQLQGYLEKTMWSRDEFFAAAHHIVSWRALTDEQRYNMLYPLNGEDKQAIQNACMEADLYLRSIRAAGAYHIFLVMGHASKTKAVSYQPTYSTAGYGPPRFQSKVSLIPKYSERLKNIVVENMDARELIKKVNNENTLLYCDPPYLHDTRGKGAATEQYYYEMNEQDHIDLGKSLREFKGRVAISGYAHPLYDDDLYKDWFSYSKGVKQTARHSLDQVVDTRIEVVWLNYQPELSVNLPGMGRGHGFD